MKIYKKINKCRSCGSSNIKNLFSLGDIPISKFYTKKKIIVPKAPLSLIMCRECKLVQLEHSVNKDLLYNNYWYRSGINLTMRTELKNIVKNACSYVKLNDGDYVLDIGANDGTLLSNYKKIKLKTIGFDPAKNLLKFSKKKCFKIISDFFNYDKWKKNFGNNKAKIVTAIAMFYDLDNPNKFIRDISKILHEDGILVIQMMYMPYSLKTNAFDGICHEHLEYYTLKSLNHILKKSNLNIIDTINRKEINEGSIRVIISKNKDLIKNKSSSQKRIKLNYELEKKIKANEELTYKKLYKKINMLKTKTKNFILSEIKKGKKFHGYAASTKGNTTLSFYEINSDHLEYISDRNPEKKGKFMSNTNIKVVDEKTSRNMKPDYYLILAWHFLPEFIKRERSFLSKGGRFLVPLPNLSITKFKE